VVRPPAARVGIRPSRTPGAHLLPEARLAAAKAWVGSFRNALFQTKSHTHFPPEGHGRSVVPLGPHVAGHSSRLFPIFAPPPATEENRAAAWDLLRAPRGAVGFEPFAGGIPGPPQFERAVAVGRGMFTRPPVEALWG